VRESRKRTNSGGTDDDEPIEHWRFAMGIAYRLLSSVIAFALHAMLPFIPIEPRLDLDATTAYLAERNQWRRAAGSRCL
jgi:hypothetical protein